ncbi:MAG TPA: DNA-formamidopyrimidine glycosylase family protein [Jatrophihabitantaceae bacterium]|jgi:endonuclease-8|nr:DNA-formamidopyrimidine glycosylase family protein [Jatrophihabitantaceae bacterium]
MPEGDTVWLTARRLNAALRGEPLTVSDFRVPQLATLDLRGIVIDEVLPRGKHLLMRLADGRTLHSHLKMDGSWYVTRAGQLPRRHPEHMIRVRLGNSRWTATGYRIHDLALLPSVREGEWVGHLGPDVMGPDWDADEAVRRLSGQPERSIAEALLDQRNLAGVGNLYKNEVLFLERVNPWTPVGEVDGLGKLVTSVQRLMWANREHPEQSTTGFLARGRQHWVYERGEQPCLRCRTPIRRAEQGEPPRMRSTYWCPSCQP